MNAGRTRWSQPGDDAGISLTELVVTMLVLSIVVIATTSLTIGFSRTNAENMSRQEQIDTARSAVESMSRTIRAAIKPSQLTGCGAGCTEDAFLVGSATAVRFYANVDNSGNSVGPSRVAYELSTTGATAGQLIESIQVPDSPTPTVSGYQYCNATAPSASEACKARLKTRPVAFGVQAGDAAPIFKYYDASGTRMTPPTSGSLTNSELARVLSVEMVVTVQAQNATRAVPTTYIQRIMLPNAQAVIRQGEEETP